MKILTSTEARQTFSSVLNHVNDEPITIQKQNHDVAVILSSARYKELSKLEDILYGKATELAIKEGLISENESRNLLESL